MRQNAYPYQSDALPRLHDAFARGKYTPWLVAPCGAGKTTVISLVAEKGQEKHRVVVRLFRRRLVEQVSERLMMNGIEYGVVMAELPDKPWACYRPRATIQVCSSQTLDAMMMAGKPLPACDLLIDDEKHAMLGSSFRAVENRLSPKWTVNLSATPVRGDGSGLPKDVCDEMIELCRIQDLMTPSERCPEARLVYTDTYEPVGLGAARRKGLGKGVAGDPVRQWINHAAGLRTLAFCNSIKECNAVRAMYLADGVRAVHINASSPWEERDECFRQLASGEVLVIVCTPSLMGVGVDIPFLECVQSLVSHDAPTSHWQAIGRAQRAHGGKTRAVWLNHSASNFIHGSPNESPRWPRSTAESMQLLERNKRDENPSEAMPQTCGACGLRSFGADVCSGCGSPLKRAMKTASGLGSVREGLSKTNHDAGGGNDTLAAQSEWWKILHSSARMGLTCGAACARFKSKYGVWPNVMGVNPVPGFGDKNKKVGEWSPDLVARTRRPI